MPVPGKGRRVGEAADRRLPRPCQLLRAHELGWRQGLGFRV